MFQTALELPYLPFQVLHIYGLGGVGKTTLLQEFCELYAQYETPAIYLDTRDIEPSPDAFYGALRLSMGLQVENSIHDKMAIPH